MGCYPPDFYTMGVPPPRYLSANFDESTRNRRDGANFIIQSSDLDKVVAERVFRADYPGGEASKCLDWYSLCSKNFTG